MGKTKKRVGNEVFGNSPGTSERPPFLGAFSGVGDSKGLQGSLTLVPVKSRETLDD